MPGLTTTSYLILGMLSSHDWSAYELAEQVGKGVTEIWPRAARQLYNAPKQLVEVGLVQARQEQRGARSRTVYSITPAGRAALRDWLRSEAAPPSLEFEGMLHVVLADQGSIQDLRHTLREVAEHAEVERQRFEALAEHIRTSGGGTFPERQHLFELSTAFMLGHYEQMAQWAQWALEHIEGWRGTSRRAALRARQQEG